MRTTCAALLLVALLASCSSDSGAIESATTTTSSPGSATTTTGTLVATTAVRASVIAEATVTDETSSVAQTSVETSVVDEEPVNDAEADLRYDIGVVTESGETDGVGWVRFDRYQFGDQQGPQLDEEPRYELATDACCRNDNTRLRTYRLADDVEVLRIDPAAFGPVCDGQFDHPWDFQAADLAPLVADGGLFAALTFDDERRVVRIREQTGC